MRKYALLLVGILMSCGAPEQEKRNDTATYFDLKNYFDKEASRLSRSSVAVNKTVVVNDSAEQKLVKISNWEKELSAFSDADINKAAWQGAFKSKIDEFSEEYTSENEKVPVKRLHISKKDGKITGILIMLENTNYLYRSTDTLSYFPDSLYQIRKSQQIKLMSPKKYLITGKF